MQNGLNSFQFVSHEISQKENHHNIVKEWLELAKVTNK